MASNVLWLTHLSEHQFSPLIREMVDSMVSFKKLYTYDQCQGAHALCFLLIHIKFFKRGIWPRVFPTPKHATQAPYSLNGQAPREEIPPVTTAPASACGVPAWSLSPLCICQWMTASAFVDLSLPMIFSDCLPCGFQTCLDSLRNCSHFIPWRGKGWCSRRKACLV